MTVHRVAGGWSPSDLARLGEALDAFPAPRRLLVQYAPNVWGYKGLNFGFCRWLLGRRRDRGDEIRLMFHEVAYPFEFPDKPKHWVLAAGQRLMARTLVKASDHVDVSTPSWARMLRVCAPRGRVEYQWRPVPSNVAVIDDPDGVSRLRRAVAPGGGAVDRQLQRVLEADRADARGRAAGLAPRRARPRGPADRPPRRPDGRAAGRGPPRPRRPNRRNGGVDAGGRVAIPPGVRPGRPASTRTA